MDQLMMENTVARLDKESMIMRLRLYAEHLRALREKTQKEQGEKRNE